MNNVIATLLFTGIALMLLVSCEKKQDPVLQEAFSVHEQAVAVWGECEAMLEDVDNTMANLKTQFENAISSGDTAMGQKIALASTQLQSFRPNVEKWEEGLVEVPGFAHSHDHGHGDGHEGHDHEHGSIPEHVKNMSPEEILALQKGLLTEIQSLKGAMQQALSDANSITQ